MRYISDHKLIQKVSTWERGNAGSRNGFTTVCLTSVNEATLHSNGVTGFSSQCLGSRFASVQRCTPVHFAERNEGLVLKATVQSILYVLSLFSSIRDKMQTKLTHFTGHSILKLEVHTEYKIL